MEANFQRKVMIPVTRKAYCFQLHKFSNENTLGTKIDFEFACEKSLCSINDFEKLSEISLFICSSWTFPRATKVDAYSGYERRKWLRHAYYF